MPSHTELFEQIFLLSHTNMIVYVVLIYRRRTKFHGHNISWVKFTMGLIFVGKSSPP